VSELKAGWVDGIATAVKSNDEKTRADALGLPVRRCWRRDMARLAASAARGGRIGGGSRRGKSRSKEIT